VATSHGVTIAANTRTELINTGCSLPSGEGPYLGTKGAATTGPEVTCTINAKRHRTKPFNDAVKVTWYSER
jgi:hypothetical protein